MACERVCASIVRTLDIVTRNTKQRGLSEVYVCIMILVSTIYEHKIQWEDNNDIFAVLIMYIYLTTNNKCMVNAFEQM